MIKTFSHAFSGVQTVSLWCKTTLSLYHTPLLKLVSTIFLKKIIFHYMIALQKLWKMFFISSKKLFSFLRYSNFFIPSSPFFVLVSHCFRAWSKINFKVYDVINCLDKNLITHCVWCFAWEGKKAWHWTFVYW